MPDVIVNISDLFVPVLATESLESDEFSQNGRICQGMGEDNG